MRRRTAWGFVLTAAVASLAGCGTFEEPDRSMAAVGAAMISSRPMQSVRERGNHARSAPNTSFRPGSEPRESGSRLLSCGVRMGGGSDQLGRQPIGNAGFMLRTRRFTAIRRLQAMWNLEAVSRGKAAKRLLDRVALPTRSLEGVPFLLERGRSGGGSPIRR
jgi:hypothetical protein